MGTRSLTHVRETEHAEDLVCMYRQMDGYTAGHGKDLKELLSNYRMVNGFTMNDTKCLKCGVDFYWHKKNKVRHRYQSAKIANGIGDLAAQIVCHFKQLIPQDIYMVEPTDEQSYEYFVWLEGDYYGSPFTQNPDVSIMLRVVCLGKVLYYGTLEDFNPMMEREASE
jgi:hypothetical protein